MGNWLLVSVRFSDRVRVSVRVRVRVMISVRVSVRLRVRVTVMFYDYCLLLKVTG